MSTPIRLGGFISGGGRTLLNLVDHIESGRLDATVPLVVSSRADAIGVDRARDRGLDVRIVPSGPPRTRHETIACWLDECGVDLVCLCGYLSWFHIDPPFAGRVINIHPALLPDFGGKGMYGLHVHRAVIESGASESGCTVHFVDEHYDHGPTILQRRCPVHADDDPATLADRVFEQECIAYPQAVQLFVDGRVELRDGRVVLAPRPIS